MNFNINQSTVPESFFKLGQSRPLFCFIFRSFLVTISMQIEESVEGVLGNRTQGRRMVGTDETTELWRPPVLESYFQIVNVGFTYASLSIF